jgi:hypothetical protein
MALKIFSGSYQTYQIDGQTFSFSPSTLPVSTTIANVATNVASFNVPLNNVQGVILIPGVNYVNELNLSGVGGVYTTLQVSPSGAITGPTVTETVKVGSFAYYSTAASLELTLYNYVVNNPTYAATFNAVDQDMQKLLEGASPLQVASQITSAIASASSTFVQLAQPLVNIADNWDTPQYTLNWGSGSTTSSGLDPAAFGVDLTTVNGASATWRVNGSQGVITVAGYTAYSTFNPSNSTITVNIANADTDGELDIASMGGASQQPMVVLGMTPLSLQGAISPLNNGDFLTRASNQVQLYGANGVAIGSPQTAGSSGIGGKEIQLANGNYVTVSDILQGSKFYTTYSISTDVADTAVVASGSDQAYSQYQDTYLGGVAKTPSGGFVIADQIGSYSSSSPSPSEVVSDYSSSGTALWSKSAPGNTIPSVTVLNNGNVAVANLVVSGSQSQIQVQLFDSAGAPIWGYLLPAGSALPLPGLDEGPGAPSVASLSNGSFVVAWDDGTNIESQLFNQSGSEIGSEIQVNPKGEILDPPAAGAGLASRQTPGLGTLPNGDFVVAWSVVDGGTSSGLTDSYLRGQMFDARGNEIGSNLEVGADGGNFSIASEPVVTSLAGGNFLVAWGQQQNIVPPLGSPVEEEEIFATPNPQITNPPNVSADFTGDRTSDVLWINPTNEIVGDWLMNNGTPTWQIVGQGSSTVNIEGFGDFTGNGTSDVLWENPTNGVVGDWLMNNNVPTWQPIGQGSTTMNIAGVGDFTGNGTSDILWQNPTNNLVGEWQMNNNVPTFELIGQGSTTMNIAGIGDFNGDGTSDILWQNPTNNLVGMWAMNGSTPTWSLIDQGSTTMKIVGVGDFTGSGTDDVLWENPTNGIVGFWEMTNGHDTSWNVVENANLAYQVAGIGDYYGNGTDDILWRNPTTGDTGIWQMNNGQATWHDFGIASLTVNPVKA